jgi:glycosyl transferase family 2
MSGDPRLSVVLPVRNGERFVRAAVESILGQTFEDFELIVLDDGSADDTPLILAELSAHDRRIRLLRTEPVGLIRTLNAGFDAARGEYVARMDADDIALPERMAAQVSALDSDPRLGLVGAAVRVFRDDDLRALYTVKYPVGDKALRAALAFGSPFAHPVVMIRRSAYARAGGYRPKFLHAEDYDLWLRMSEVSRLANLSEPLLHYRTHSTQVSLVQAEQQVLSVVGAQIASQSRRAGESEPFSDDRPISLEEMLAAGVLRGTEVADALVAAATASALQMIMMRQHARATELLDWARRVAPPGRLSRRTRARTALARAGCYWSAGQRWHSALNGTIACLSDPLTVGKLMLTATRTLAWRAASG